MRSLWLIALILTTADICSAANIYVDNLAGDDRRNGLEAKSLGVGNGPVRTIAKALRLAQKGDRIILANNPGSPYRESIAISGGFHSGIATYPFELIGNGATLDGSLSLANGEWEFVSGQTFRVRPPRGAYQRLFLNDQPAEFIASQGDARAMLKPLQWTLIQGQIYFCCEKDKIPASYNLSCCGLRTGITIYQVEDVQISDLTVRGFELDGVNAADTAYKTKLLGVVSQDNGRSGFTVGGASRVTLDQCTGTGNGNSQLRAEGYSQTTIRDCELDSKSAPALVRDGGRVFQIKP
ncbi:right-handed parallel beta-helix repeat-containing protein [Anatilimnocola floriformis]|uniref:right-handed parallel beta-helix repeat-containing protein n=1 Tax=Anatilimnocola floriformis TaxID=2948575 RepID=UPI0020C23BD2|nr:right-handed parallel beta-helix repeat-containing protein [Anatilimnocola floriformis]